MCNIIHKPSYNNIKDDDNLNKDGSISSGLADRLPIYIDEYLTKQYVSTKVISHRK